MRTAAACLHINGTLLVALSANIYALIRNAVLEEAATGHTGLHTKAFTIGSITTNHAEIIWLHQVRLHASDAAQLKTTIATFVLVLPLNATLLVVGTAEAASIAHSTLKKARAIVAALHTIFCC